MTTPPSDKPKWLRRLERESWQAELIISGAAILGSLQLPGLMDRLEVYLLLHHEREGLQLLLYVVLYWRLLAVILIFLFFSHFIVRALWIGLVGLNSVFPGGFRANERFSLDYQEKLRAEYGDVDGYINRLDGLASGMFGAGFGLAGLLLNFGMVGGVLVLLYGWLLKAGLDSTYIYLLFGILLAIPFFASLGSTLFHLPRFRDREWVRRIHYPLAKLVYYFMYPINRRYTVTSLSMISNYYADRRGYWAYVIVGALVFGVIGGVVVTNDPYFPYFNDNYYHRVAADSTRYFASAYADQSFDGLHVRPELRSDRIEPGEPLTVWVPLPERETAVMYDGCPAPQPAEGLTGVDLRLARYNRTLACARDYVEFSLNGRPVADFSLRREYRTNAAGHQFGVRATLHGAQPRAGENLLGVVTKYPKESTGEFRRAYVLFHYPAE